MTSRKLEIQEERALDTAILLSDFPFLADPKLRARLVDTICQHAKISAVHSINTDGTIEAKLVVDGALKELLPQLYHRCYVRREFRCFSREVLLNCDHFLKNAAEIVRNPIHNILRQSQ